MQKTTPSVALVETTIFESQFSGKGLFCFSSICKFDCLKNPYATITSLSQLYFRFRRFILLVQNKVISINYGDGDRVKPDLIFTIRVIYINSNLNPLLKFTSSSKSTKFKDILPWNISQTIMKTIPMSTRTIISYAMKRAIPFWVCRKVNGNWDKNMIRISKWRESQNIVEQELEQEHL